VGYIDEIERVGQAVESGELTRDEAVDQLRAVTGDRFDDWRLEAFVDGAWKDAREYYALWLRSALDDAAATIPRDATHRQQTLMNKVDQVWAVCERDAAGDPAAFYSALGNALMLDVAGFMYYEAMTDRQLGIVAEPFDTAIAEVARYCRDLAAAIAADQPAQSPR
jgi:hypothetical protein